MKKINRELRAFQQRLGGQELHSGEQTIDIHERLSQEIIFCLLTFHRLPQASYRLSHVGRDPF